MKLQSYGPRLRNGMTIGCNLSLRITSFFSNGGVIVSIQIMEVEWMISQGMTSNGRQNTMLMPVLGLIISRLN